MTDINKMINEMPREVYERLLSGVELGKWEDGTRLSPEQVESTMQLVMLYQARHLQQTDHLTINSEGALNELSKSQLKKQFKGEPIAEFKEKDL
ncbi:DUF1315 family protein [Shewanella eurypsychrophilus]|uniref:DUF1315 family protein n=1 Tax=Shewanella eurypsychrophilus TaxID=2593656 RepID=A0ABX6VCG7_9GAMM|nr:MULTISPECIES: DUF1315 family protein [Shewanella]QFU22901.1 DUF1315 family protein [Shewanella sp. YLB-09]QPG58187.1 DUF1315 family protein [Shewanella eurypsychrophilus]